MRAGARASSAGTTSGSGFSRAVLLAILTALVLALPIHSAFAATSHLYETSFGPDGTSGTIFEKAAGVAIDQQSGDIYVADSALDTIYKFDESHQPSDFSALGSNEISGLSIPGGAGESQIAVDPDSHRIYAISGKSILAFEADGEPAYFSALGTPSIDATVGSGKFLEPLGVAVDSNGAIYAADYGGGHGISVFAASGEGLTQVSTQEAGTVAVDSTGSLYVNRYSSSVEEFIPSAFPVTTATTYASAGTIDPEMAFSLAVNPVSDDLYVDHGNSVAQLRGGAQIGSFAGSGPGAVVSSTGLAVKGAGAAERIYVSDTGGAQQVEIFGPGILVPDAAATPATAIKPTSATVNGLVGAAGGPPATCEFQYTTQEGFQSEGFAGATTAPCAPAGPFTGSGQEAVSADAIGLIPNTKYFFRLVGANENGLNPSRPSSFTSRPAVTVETGKASAISGTIATLNATLNPEGVELLECNFEYGPGEEFYDHTVPCAEAPVEIGDGDVPTQVHVDLTGLTPLAIYHFRVVARNSIGTSFGKDFLFGPPQLEATSFSGVTSTGASLQGLVNPNGVATTYVFQYVSEAAFVTEGEWAKATSVPTGGEAIGSGSKPLGVFQQLTDLTPRTTYHFRIVAESEAGAQEGPGRTFTTYSEPDGGLPDSRVYEQVTPVDKNGSAPSGGVALVQAALNGNGLTYFSNGSIPGSEGAQQFPNYLATRGSDWATQGLLPPASAGATAVVLGWSENLLQAYVRQAPGPEVPLRFLQRDNAMRSFRSIAVGGGKSSISYAGAPVGSGSVFFESSAQLLPEATVGEVNSYVWNEATGDLSLLGVLNDGSIPAGGTGVGSNISLDRRHYLQTQHAISSDGSQVFFSATASGQLYLRANPTRSQSSLTAGKCDEPALACTTQVSASQSSVPDPNGEQPATFWGATANGSDVFFTSPGKLTDDATTGPADEGADLYRYNVENEELVDLVPDLNDPKGADVRGVLGISDDGAYVYFAANGVLAAGATQGDCSPNDTQFAGIGTCNLYLWHEGSVAFISQLVLRGAYDFSDSQNWLSSLNAYERTARVTPDGKTLLFRTQQPLTAYENDVSSGECITGSLTPSCPEFYVYHAQTNSIACVSCVPTGAAPTGAPALRSIASGAGTQPPPAPFLVRNLSADGDQVFFESPDKLVASDANGVRDVYEWRAAGTGACPSDASDTFNGGCLYLLSTGTSPEPSYFGDASLGGDDVFLFTVQPLVGQDKDQIRDIYVASVGGGIASQNPPPPPIPCGGEEACRGALAPPPPTQFPGSASFSGPGNQKPSHKKKKKKTHHKKHQKKRHTTRKHG